MNKFIAIFQMLVKAPTLFIYSIYAWSRKIDSHKAFLTCMLQESLVVLVMLAYVTTKGANILGICILVCACVLSLFFNYLICGAPRYKDEWIYIVTGKYTEAQLELMRQYQEASENARRAREAQVAASVTQEQPVYTEPCTPDVVSNFEDVIEEDCEDIAQKIIVEDEAANTEDKQLQSETTLEQLSEGSLDDLGIDLFEDTPESDITTGLSEPTVDVVETAVVADEIKSTKASQQEYVTSTKADQQEYVAPKNKPTQEVETVALTEQQELDMEDTFRKTSVDYSYMDSALASKGIIDGDSDDGLGLGIPDEI